MTRIALVGGGIAGLAALHRLRTLVPDAELVLVEEEERLGGKILTEHAGGFVIEAAPDSFLSRKERGVGLCEEIGLAAELVGRRSGNERTFVRRGRSLLRLPSGLSGMIPTDLDALDGSELLSPEGRARLAAEMDLPPAAGVEDESIAAFASRRLGREAYEVLVEPLMTGIYGGDGEQLSLRATFPALRTLELEHGSVLRGLRSQPAEGASRYPPFVSLRSGMGTLVSRLAEGLDGVRFETGSRAVALRRRDGGYALDLDGAETVDADAVVLSAPAFAISEILADLDHELAAALAEIPYASSAIVTLAFRRGDVSRPLDAYGYVVPRVEGTDVLACTWTSSKWEGRAPEGEALIRVYAGRYGADDVTLRADDELVELARDELGLVGIDAEPSLVRVQRWPRGMPQYVLGHPDRLERIDAALEAHPGLALAGAAYRGVGIPDCIRSGEDAARSVTRSLDLVPR